MGGILGGLCHEFATSGSARLVRHLLRLAVIGEWDLMDSGTRRFSPSRWLEATRSKWRTPLADRPLRHESLLLASRTRSCCAHPGLGDLVASDDDIARKWARSARLDVSPTSTSCRESARSALRPCRRHERCPYLNRDAATGVILWTSRADDVIARANGATVASTTFHPSPSAPESQLGSAAKSASAFWSGTWTSGFWPKVMATTRSTSTSDSAPAVARSER